MTNSDEGTIVEITLNSAGLASINASAGGDWAVGGTLNNIPEPTTLPLLGLGLVVCKMRRSRRES